MVKQPYILTQISQAGNSTYLHVSIKFKKLMSINIKIKGKKKDPLGIDTAVSEMRDWN